MTLISMTLLEHKEVLHKEALLNEAQDRCEAQWGAAYFFFLIFHTGQFLDMEPPLATTSTFHRVLSLAKISISTQSSDNFES